jgi:hypothetical protein
MRPAETPADNLAACLHSPLLKLINAGDFILRTAFAITSLMVGIAFVTAPVALADPPYRNCAEAHADGRYNIPSSDPAYQSKLDRDGDGFACEPYKGK